MTKIKTLAISIALITVSLTTQSCKKQYTCSCTNTITYNNTSSSNTESEPYDAKLTKQKAEELCLANEYSTVDNSGGIIAVKCEVK